MTIEELFNHLRVHDIFEDCIVKMRISTRETEQELTVCNKVLYYDDEEDDYYWFDDFIEEDCIKCEILGFSVLREIEIPIIDI